MKHHNTNAINALEITPKELFYARRQFMQLTAGATLAALLPNSVWAGTKLSNVKKSAYTLMDELTPFKDVTQYNNFYEFGTAKEDPAKKSLKPKNPSLDSYCGGRGT